MKGLRNYVIPYKGLKEGNHIFSFEVREDFFGEFENSEIQSGELDVLVKLEKREHFLKLDFDIEGTVDVLCDRCLTALDINVGVKEVLYIKFGENKEEETDEIIVLPYSDSEYNVGQFIYDTISLSLPYQKIHLDDENGFSTCDSDMMERLGEYLVDEESKEKDIDPRWDDLRKMLGNN